MCDILCPLECVREDDFFEKNNAFLITLISSISAVLSLVFTYCIKSRCKNIRTPCICCDRDVIEIKNDNIEINNVA